VEQKWVWLTPGSVTATALWLLSSLGFKWYVIHFGNYQRTYGAIGGVIVTLLWFYFSGLAVLLGAQLNATIRQASTDGWPADRRAHDTEQESGPRSHPHV